MIHRLPTCVDGMARVKAGDVRAGTMIFGDGLVKVNLDDMDLGTFGSFGFNSFKVNCGCEGVDGIDFRGSNEGDSGASFSSSSSSSSSAAVEPSPVSIAEEDSDPGFDFLPLHAFTYRCL